MLRLLVTNNDIVKISKVLGNYKVKASITKSTIIIESNEVPDEVVEVILNNATIIKAQNYQSDEQEQSDEPAIIVEETGLIEEDQKTEPIDAEQETESIDAGQEEECVTVIENKEDDEEISEVILENSVMEINSEITVKKPKVNRSNMIYRGEVYKWGISKEVADVEGSVKECVIIIQNDYQNSASEETIALFCTTNFSERALFWSSFRFISGNMLDHSCKRIGVWWDQSTFFISHIIGLNRNELGPYVGTMNNQFMNSIQPAIDYCLGLKRSRTVNWNQLKILSTVNIDDLFEISESELSSEKKLEEFLKIFGFDMSCNGMNYLKDAILIATKLDNYRLEHLAQAIAEKQEVNPKEVLRIIIARVKERFNFKKSPAISFVRLIERFLKG